MYYILRLISSPALIIVDGSLRSSLDGDLSKSDTKVSKMKWNNPSPISLNQIEVAVDTTYEQHPTSRTTFSVGAQQSDKPRALSVGSDLESVIETGLAK